MLYRETGQFKTSYAADMAIFPIRQDRIALWALLIFAFIGIPVLDAFQVWPLRGEYLHARHPHSVPDPVARRGRLEHPHRLLRPALARQRRVHGDRRLQRLQVRHRHRDPAGNLHHQHSAAAGVLVHPARRPDGGVRRHPVRRAEPAHQGALSRGRHAGGAVLLRLGVHPREVVHQLHRVRLGGCAGAEFLRLLRQQADREISASASSSSRCSRCWRRTSFAATSGGNGWRSATWTSPPS